MSYVYCVKFIHTYSSSYLSRLITDILFGLKFGMKTLLVLTGADTIKDLEDTPSDKKPHYYSQSIAGFLTCIAE